MVQEFTTSTVNNDHYRLLKDRHSEICFGDYEEGYASDQSITSRFTIGIMCLLMIAGGALLRAVTVAYWIWRQEEGQRQ